MRADLEVLLNTRSASRLAMEFLLGTPAALVEGLHPEGFGDVGDGFGEPMQSGGAGIQARGEALPPGVKQGIDGVGRAAADFLADFFDRRALTRTQQRVGGEFYVAGRDAAGGCAVARSGVSVESDM